MRPALVLDSRLLAATVLVLSAPGCFRPPDGPLVEGPTLGAEIATASQANVAQRMLVASAPLDDAAQAAHADFLAANAATIGGKWILALQGARVILRPGTGVDDLADAFDGLTMFVAPESDPTVRVPLASVVAPASQGPIELGPIASRLDYEMAQPVLTAPRFIVGVSGPTPLAIDGAVEFGLRVELELAIIELKTGGGHGP
jgi:hypothetical protein